MDHAHVSGIGKSFALLDPVGLLLGAVTNCMVLDIRSCM